MKVTVDLNRRALKVLAEAQAKAMSQTASQLIGDVRNAHVMPFDIGTLQNEGTFVDESKVREGVITIVHDTPYARRLYFNPQYNFNQSKNPNARGEWWEDWITGSKKKRASEIFQALYRRETRRYVE